MHQVVRKTPRAELRSCDDDDDDDDDDSDSDSDNGVQSADQH